MLIYEEHIVCEHNSIGRDNALLYVGV